MLKYFNVLAELCTTQVSGNFSYPNSRNYRVTRQK